MVCPQFKVATEEIVAEVSNEGHYSKEFSQRHTISSFVLGEGTASVSHHSFFSLLHLRKHSSNSCPTSICVQNKGQVVVWEGQDWGCCKAMFQLLEGICTRFRPAELTAFLCQPVEGLSNSCKVLDELPVVAGQS